MAITLFYILNTNKHYIHNNFATQLHFNLLIYEYDMLFYWPLL